MKLSNQDKEPTFWKTLDELVNSCPLVIDRPRGTVHPRYPDWIYPIDYGYLSGTITGDGSGVDAWIGSEEPKQLDSILLTVDLLKKDIEVKLLLGCTEVETLVILDFLNTKQMTAIIVPRSKTHNNQ